ncbi:MAG: squalene/phytoene synthase family protein [Chloroflexota bacterium]
MSVQSSWEVSLMSLAEEAFHEGVKTTWDFDREKEVLAEAYELCDQITAENSKSFFMSSALLRGDKKRGARALYAFCRVTDDIVDEPIWRNGAPPTAENIFEDMQVWKSKSLSSTPSRSNLVALAWADTRARFKIPLRFAEQLIDGVMQDMDTNRYYTFDQLASYSYGVASTVGLMSMHITGFSGQEAIPYAIRLGVALQLTNILRDVGEDWRNGRIYLPVEELEAFGLTEENIAIGEVSERWRRFMRFQIFRNRQLYLDAAPGIKMLDKDGRFAIAASAGLYEAILQDIEKHDYDVFSRRSYVSTAGKLAKLPKIWFKSRF